MKRKIISLISLVFLSVFILSITSCSPMVYEVHGMDEYFNGSIPGNSETEMDEFDGVDSLYNGFNCISADYDYKETQTLPFIEVLEVAILVFRYEELDYQNAKQFCFENMQYIGQTPSEAYNGYDFYDYYENRPKEEYYYNDNFPYGFKRVVICDEKNEILLLGVNVSVERYEEIDDDVKDWGTFLEKYFGEYYSFENW